MKSVIVTSIQFLCLGWILAINPWLAPNVWLMVVQFAGLGIGMWAILKMLKSKINVAPDVRRGSILITTGPYKILRHPMYTSLLLFVLPLVIGYPDASNLIVCIILMINLLIKLHYEETLLENYFPDYKTVMKGRWRLFPWIY